MLNADFPSRFFRDHENFEHLDLTKLPQWVIFHVSLQFVTRGIECVCLIPEGQAPGSLSLVSSNAVTFICPLC